MWLDVHDLFMFNVQWSFFTYGQTKDFDSSLTTNL